MAIGLNYLKISSGVGCALQNLSHIKLFFFATNDPKLYRVCDCFRL